MKTQDLTTYLASLHMSPENIPGMAIAVWEDGEITSTKCSNGQLYGLRTLHCLEFGWINLSIPLEVFPEHTSNHGFVRVDSVAVAQKIKSTLIKYGRDQVAIKKAIKHWENMRDNPFDSQETPTATYCALCQIYKNESDDYTCTGCPVSEVTGFPSCQHTPYKDAFLAWDNAQSSHVRLKEIGLASWKYNAQKEIDFLTSLL